MDSIAAHSRLAERIPVFIQPNLGDSSGMLILGVVRVLPVRAKPSIFLAELILAVGGGRG